MHFHHRLLHMLLPAEVKLLQPRKPLAGFTPRLPIALAERAAPPGTSR